MNPDLPRSSRKVRFAPKPPRRNNNKVELKTEPSRRDASDDEAPDDRLLRRANEHLNRGKAKVEKKPSQVALSPGVASSAPLRTYGNPREGTTDIGLKDSGNADQQNLVPLPSNTKVDGDEGSSAKAKSKEKKKREYREPWDYENSYYPITLPLRKPYSGDPEILDAEEFGEEATNVEYDESKINAASELGLKEDDGPKTEDGPKMFFIQIPNNLPSWKGETLPTASSAKGKEVVEVPISAKGKEKVEVPISGKGKEKVENPTVLRRTPPKKGCTLEELPGVKIGKMLVYKSGAVKMKLGETIYNVSPGSGFAFPQEVVAINTGEKSCSKLGDIDKHAVVTPDIDSLSASDLDSDHTSLTR